MASLLHVQSLNDLPLPSVEKIKENVPTQQQWDEILIKSRSFGQFGKVTRTSDNVIDYCKGKLIIPPDGYCLLNSLCQIINLDRHEQFELETFVNVLAAYHQNGVVSEQIIASYTSQFMIPVYRHGEIPVKSGLILVQMTSNLIHVCAYVQRSFKYYIISDTPEINTLKLLMTQNIRVSKNQLQVKFNADLDQKVQLEKKSLRREAKEKQQGKSQRQKIFNNKIKSQLKTDFRMTDEERLEMIEQMTEKEIRAQHLCWNLASEVSALGENAKKSIMKNIRISLENATIYPETDGSDMLCYIWCMMLRRNMHQQHFPKLWVIKSMKQVVILSQFSKSKFPQYWYEDEDFISINYKPLQKDLYFGSTKQKIDFKNVIRKIKSKSVDASKIMWCSADAIASNYGWQNQSPQYISFQNFIINNNEILDNMVTPSGLQQYLRYQRINYIYFENDETTGLKSMYVLLNFNWHNFVVINYDAQHFTCSIPKDHQQYVEIYNYGYQQEPDFSYGSLRRALNNNSLSVQQYQDLDIKLTHQKASLFFIVDTLNIVKAQTKCLNYIIYSSRTSLPQLDFMTEQYFYNDGKSLTNEFCFNLSKAQYQKMVMSKQYSVYVYGQSDNLIIEVQPDIKNMKPQLYYQNDIAKSIDFYFFLALMFPGIWEVIKPLQKFKDLVLWYHFNCDSYYRRKMFPDRNDILDSQYSRYISVSPQFEYTLTVTQDYLEGLKEDTEFTDMGTTFDSQVDGDEKIQDNQIVCQDNFPTLPQVLKPQNIVVSTLPQNQVLDMIAKSVAVIDPSQDLSQQTQPLLNLSKQCESNILGQSSSYDDCSSINSQDTQTNSSFSNCVYVRKVVDNYEDLLVQKPVLQNSIPAIIVDESIADTQQLVIKTFKDDSILMRDDKVGSASLNNTQTRRNTNFLIKGIIFKNYQNLNNSNPPIDYSFSSVDKSEIIKNPSGTSLDLLDISNVQIQSNDSEISVIQLNKIIDELSTADLPVFDCSLTPDLIKYFEQLTKIDHQLLRQNTYKSFKHFISHCRETTTRSIQRQFQHLKNVDYNQEFNLFLQKSKAQWMVTQQQYQQLKKKIVMIQNSSFFQKTGSIIQKIFTEELYHVSFKLPLISPLAHSQLGMPLILSLHDVNHNVINNKNRPTQSGFRVSGFNSKTQVVANMRGALNKNVLQLLSKFGFEISKEMMEGGSNVGSGHDNLRYVVNCLISECINKIMNLIFQKPLNENDDTQYFWIDIGSKFKALQTIILKFVEKIFKPKEAQNPNDPDVWEENEETKLVTESWKKRKIIFQPVRPNDNQYDKVYYKQNLNEYLSVSESQDRNSKTFVDFREPFEGTIEEFEGQNQFNQNYEYIYSAFDVHYYLSGWTPKVDCLLLVCGGLFFPCLGQYDLPLREGRVTIVNKPTQGLDHETFVSMCTQGQGTVYQHPLVDVLHRSHEVDFGWYKLFNSIIIYTQGDDSPFQKIKIPNYNFQSSSSVQYEYILNAYDQFGAKIGDLQCTQANVMYYKQQAPKIKIFDQVIHGRYSSKSDEKQFNFRYWTQLLGQKTADGNAELLIKSWPIFSFVEGRVNTISLKYSPDSYLSRICKFFTEYKLKFFDLNVVTLYKETNTVQEQLHSNMYFGKVTPIIDLYQLLSNVPLEQFTRQDKINIRKLEEIYAPNDKVKALPNKKHPYQNDIKFYFAKKLEKKHIENSQTINPQILPKNKKLIEMYDDNYNAICKWLDLYNYPVISVNRGRDLAPMKTQSTSYPTGFSILNEGKNLLEYEFSSQCVQNRIFALHQRQFASKPRFNHEYFNKYKKMVNRFMKWFRIEINKQNFDHIEIADPFQWLDNKDNFDKAKKQKYRETIMEQMKNPECDYLSTYTTMVKSGETYFAEQLEVDDCGFLINVKERPRNVCAPAPSGCGLLTFFQSLLWNNIKNVIPGFIQGLTKEDMKETYKKYISLIDDPISLSMDSSAFDSSQHGYLQRVVDNTWWTILTDIVFSRIHNNPRFINCDLSKMKQNVQRTLNDNNYYLFVNVPNVKGPSWPKDVQRLWNRDHSKDNGIYSEEVTDNWLCYCADGSVFSGDPVHTTNTNTIRSLTYLYLVCEENGVMDPWVMGEKLLVFCSAAGDDAVIHCSRWLGEKLRCTILLNSSRTKNDEEPVGLGQVIEFVKISDWYDFDFCSKWSFCDGEMSSWEITRDMQKTLLTKHYYQKRNKNIQNYPSLHCEALYLSIKSEKVSKLLEDFFMYRLNKWRQLDVQATNVNYSIDLLKLANNRLQYEFSDNEVGYNYENEINFKVGVSYYDLLLLLQKDTLFYGGVESKDSDSYIYINVISENIQMSEPKQLQKSKKRNRKNTNNGITAVNAYHKIENQKKFTGQSPSYEQIQQKQYNSQFQEFYDDLMFRTKGQNMRSLLSEAGVKLCEKLDKSFKTADINGKRQILLNVLADDIPPQILDYAMKVAPFVMNNLWNSISKTKPMRYIIDQMKSVLGIDLNDDYEGYNKFNFNGSFQQNLDWSKINPSILDDQFCFDGVNAQSIASVLAPEYSQTRFPSDTGTKTGLYSRVTSQTVITNAAGNAIVVIFPDYIAATSGFQGFINIYNDSTLNVDTGVQTPNCSSIAGPMNSLVGFNQLRVTGLCVQLQSVVSQLNNQGRVVSLMNNSNFGGTNTAAIVGLNNARDREYAVYTSMQSINGHRMTYVNNGSLPGEFGTLSNDFIAFIITGAQPSTQVLQLNIHYNVEFTISPGSLVTVEPPPLGPFTLQCLSTALSRRPDLRLIGSQELKELYCQLASCKNRYQYILDVLLNYQFKHQHDEVNFNKGAELMMEQVQQQQQSRSGNPNVRIMTY